MRARCSVICGGLLALIVIPARMTAADTPAAAALPKGAVAVWDTHRPATDALSSSALTTKRDWTQLPAGKPVASIEGDAVVSNGRVYVIVRKHSPAVEVYGVGAAGPLPRVRLMLLAANEPATQFDSVAVAENSKTAVSLEARYRTAGGAPVSAKFRLKRGDVTLETVPLAGAARMRFLCQGRFMVLPDFFADDMVIDALKLPSAATEVPSDNFLLQPIGDGDAIALSVFEKRKGEAGVLLEDKAGGRVFTGSEIPFEEKKIWLALLEAPAIWHTRDLKPADASKVLRLAWQMPFPAQWRVDFTRPNGLTDSWEMLLQQPGHDDFIKPSWLGGGSDQVGTNRRRWNTVLGTYRYPCWSDATGKGYVEPLQHKHLHFKGPTLIYPIHRVPETPLDAFTVVDVMRATLGVGPCEYLLDLEGQKAEYRGRATCSSRDVLQGIYSKKEQKKRRDEVEKVLQDDLIFVTHIRGRITRYTELGHQLRQYLTEQKKSRPELAEFAASMEELLDEMDRRVEARADKIKTPAYVAAMNDRFRKEVLDYEGPDALDRCRKYALALVEIGDNQDELSGECRWVVKSLRQRAGLWTARDPRTAAVASEIRARAQEALRNPANHEGAHH
jgi:hypothetical protein